MASTSNYISASNKYMAFNVDGHGKMKDSLDRALSNSPWSPDASHYKLVLGPCLKILQGGLLAE